MKKVYFFIIISFFISCQGSKNNTLIESIDISYLKGNIETKKPFFCGFITSIKPTFSKKDTILTDPQKYKEILAQLLKLRIDSTSSNCDVRIECKVNLSNRDSIKICIGSFNCIMKNGRKMINNDTLVYLVRRYSGYYNYFTKENLSFFPEIKLFGIPSNYKCLIRMADPNGQPMSPSKAWLD